MLRARHLTTASSGLLLACLVFLSGCTDSTPRLPPLQENTLILAFGDSLTFGTGQAKTRATRSYCHN